MILRKEKWTEIREQFTESERAEIKAHIRGEVICPAGWDVDVESLAQATGDKLWNATRANTKGGK